MFETGALPVNCAMDGDRTHDQFQVNDFDYIFHYSSRQIQLSKTNLQGQFRLLPISYLKVASLTRFS